MFIDVIEINLLIGCFYLKIKNDSRNQRNRVFSHLFACNEVSRQKPGFWLPTNDDKINFGVISYPLTIMDESRAQAYTNLIHQLLSYPKGEEPQILQDKLELVECEFLWCQDYLQVIMEENKR